MFLPLGLHEIPKKGCPGLSVGVRVDVPERRFSTTRMLGSNIKVSAGTAARQLGYVT
jgi:hypothetical protein